MLRSGHYSVICLLIFCGLVPSISCKSHGLAPVSPDDPYAENAPKTKEEEAYYQDVYSGNWQKSPSSMGAMGISKTTAGTKAPDHWSMTPPKGAKSMGEIYEENYQKQMAAHQDGFSNSANGVIAGTQNPAASVAMNPNESYGRTDSHSAASSVPSYGTAGNAAPNNGSADGAGNPNNANPSSGYIAPQKDDSQDVKTYEKSNSVSRMFNGWTQSTPVISDDAGDSFLIIRGQEPDQNESISNEPEKKTDDSSAETADDSTHNSAGDSADNSTGDANLAGSAGPALSGSEGTITLEADPALSESWQKINRDGLRAESAQNHQPRNEYIADGGDDGSEAYIGRNGEVRHLDPEDTVASFQTADGQKLVEPSNTVHIYSPRFGSVRQVFGVESDTQNFRLHGAGIEVGPVQHEGQAGIDIRSQEEQANLSRGKLAAAGTAANQPGGALAAADGTIEQSAQQKVGDLGAKMMTGDAKVLAKLRSADSALAVGTWGEIQEVSVEIDKNSAQGMVRMDQAQALFVIETETKTSKLQLFKMASKKEAAPGELIEFAIRYENVGAETIETISILDSLSARLEYVEGSAKSSRPSLFSIAVNPAGSSQLKWEITEPLERNQYGVISFLCRVR